LDLDGQRHVGQRGAGQLIGTDQSGTATRQHFDGVAILFGATANTVGGTVSGAATSSPAMVSWCVSGRQRHVWQRVLGNKIGTDMSGSATLGNFFTGVDIRGGATANTVGGTVSGAANVISGNGRYGVDLLDGGTSGNVGWATGSAPTSTAPPSSATPSTACSSKQARRRTRWAAPPPEPPTSSPAMLLWCGAVQRHVGNVVLGNLIGTDRPASRQTRHTEDGVGIDLGATANHGWGTASGAANVHLRQCSPWCVSVRQPARRATWCWQSPSAQTRAAPPKLRNSFDGCSSY